MVCLVFPTIGWCYYQAKRGHVCRTTSKVQGLRSLNNETIWRQKGMRFWAGIMAGQWSGYCRGGGSLGPPALPSDPTPEPPSLCGISHPSMSEQSVVLPSFLVNVQFWSSNVLAPHTWCSGSGEVPEPLTVRMQGSGVQGPHCHFLMVFEVTQCWS